ncbi:hypothetical protein [Methanobrevibacter sp.]|uniref:hypothetical protein n=1 Tax=Methanobrevibacter sp. TaxID=66852 RepID=UPI00389036BD
MDYEAFKLRSVIFDNKFRIERKHVEFDSGISSYEVLVHDIGHNALDIVGFFKYFQIVSSVGPIEKELHNLIASKTNSASVLQRVAFERRHYIYDEKIHVDIDGEDYVFKIDGIGPQAVKITVQITYDEIANSTKPLESKLRKLINTLYQGPLNNKETLDKINDTWQKEEAHKQKVHEEVLKDEEIRAQKQKELEDFLNSW